MLRFAPRSPPLRLLCVEEDAIQRKLLQACLDVAGAEVLFAESAARAVFLFHHHAVEIVLMDFDLHSASELAAFEHMRATRGGRVPILAVTDNECRWSEEDYRDVGFASLYTKPVEPTRLIAAIDHVLRAASRPPLLEAGADFEPRFAYLH
jgi:CheY-like chemotaxis protein